MSFFRKVAVLIAVVILFVFGLLFAIGNADAVSIMFLKYESLYLPLFVWLIVSFAFGILVGVSAVYLSTGFTKSKKPKTSENRSNQG